MTSAVNTLIDKGIKQLSFTLEPLARQRVVDYLELLQKWNKAYNLTAVRSIEEMVPKHLFDSLVIAPFIHGQRILDVGTGAGLPGIPLAITYPQKEFVLMDSNGKKTSFLIQAKQTLGLDNVQIVHSRVEAYSQTSGFDSIVSRAFASIIDMLKLTQHLLAPNGQFLAMKGVYPEQEILAIPKEYTVLNCHRLQVPGLEAERHLVCISMVNHE